MIFVVSWRLGCGLQLSLSLCTDSSGFSGHFAGNSVTQHHTFTLVVPSCIYMDFGGADVTFGCQTEMDIVGYFSQFRIETGHNRVYHYTNLYSSPS